MELSLPYQSARTLKGPLGYSAAFHLLLSGAVLFGGIFAPHGEEWGGQGGQGAININLVGNVPAIPLPKPDVETNSRTVDTTKGLYQAEPQPVKPPDDANAIYLPKFDRDKTPQYITKPSKVLPNPEKTPPNAIPYGNGGTPQIPTSTFRVTQDTKGGMGVTGTSGGSLVRSFRGTWRRSSGGSAATGWNRRSIRRFRLRRAARCRFRFCRTGPSPTFKSRNRAETNRWTRRRFARCRVPIRWTDCRQLIAARTSTFSFGSSFIGSKRQ